MSSSWGLISYVSFELFLYYVNSGLFNKSEPWQRTEAQWRKKIKTHTCELMLTVNAGGVFDVDEIFLWLRNKNAWIKANKNNGAGNDTFIIHDGAFAIYLFFHLLIYYFLFIIRSCAVSRRMVASQFKQCILNVIYWGSAYKKAFSLDV